MLLMSQWIIIQIHRHLGHAMHPFGCLGLVSRNIFIAHHIFMPLCQSADNVRTTSNLRQQKASRKIKQSIQKAMGIIRRGGYHRHDALRLPTERFQPAWPPALSRLCQVHTRRGVGHSALCGQHVIETQQEDNANQPAAAYVARII